MSAEVGFYALRKNGRKVAFQSSLERSFVQLCDFANEVEQIAWEPFTLLFDDLVTGRERRYTPDYLVETTACDGDRFSYVVEIKSKAEAARIWRDQPQGTAARAHIAMMTWCALQPAYQFLLISEDVMEAKGLANMRAIQDRATFTVTPELRELVLQLSGVAAGTTLRHVLGLGQSLGLTRGACVSSFLRMCADDELWFDITRPLDETTEFTRGPRRRVFLR